jgi:hypothetical protein
MAVIVPGYSIKSQLLLAWHISTMTLVLYIRLRTVMSFNLNNGLIVAFVLLHYLYHLFVFLAYSSLYSLFSRYDLLLVYKDYGIS